MSREGTEHSSVPVVAWSQPGSEAPAVDKDLLVGLT